MPKFRKKPVVIEAVQLNWQNWSQVCEFLGDSFRPARMTKEYSDDCGEQRDGGSRDFIEMTIPTLEGDMLARHGDWLIKGVNGEFYPCKPDIFEKSYEPVAERGSDAESLGGPYR